MEPLAPVRRDDALALWRAYADQPHAARAPGRRTRPSSAFGDNAALADELLDLVLAGTKRATAGPRRRLRARGRATAPDRRSLGGLRRRRTPHDACCDR